jgi:putative phosphoesterase
MRIGLIADTHGLLREEATTFLHRCDHIIHAGDICDESVLKALVAIAPLTAVRGNNDKGSWAVSLPETDLVQLGGACIYVVHDLAYIDIDPSAAGVQVVVSGHSHKPSIESREGVLFINPGSAGPRRFKLPISLAELTVKGDAVSARIVDLESASVA